MENRHLNIASSHWTRSDPSGLWDLSAHANLSRLFSEYSAATDSLAASQRALKLNPSDAEAHYIHGLQLSNAGQLAEAISEVERAIKLRPKDYFLWQELGRLRDENSDSQGAIHALQTATRFAPFYAQPHWQLGNLLLRDDQTANAFREMRIAASSDPELFSTMVDLAWGVYEGNARQVVEAVAASNDHESAVLADFLFQHDSKDTALEIVRGLKEVSRNDLAHLVEVLTRAEEFDFAYRLWSGKDVELCDGGFEQPINVDNSGFGWQPTKLTQTVKVLLDSAQSQNGKHSLRIDYSGNFDEATPVITQLVPVEKNSQYRLAFYTRSENLMSAGLPNVVVKSATGEKQMLAESSALNKGTNRWSAFSFVFDTDDKMKAISVNIQRAACNVKPCPIVGRAWFDGFVLTKLK